MEQENEVKFQNRINEVNKEIKKYMTFLELSEIDSDHYRSEKIKAKNRGLKTERDKLRENLD